MHVSIISVASFLGRLVSGIGSDFLVKRMRKSRFWCIVAASSIFAGAQLAGLNVTNPNMLWLVSSTSGLAYGALFGVYPALVVDAFGVSGLSLNWGFMTLAPVIWGNVFNLLYGRVFDDHSVRGPDGDVICDQGQDCYRVAYWVTFLASLVSILVSLGTVARDGRKMKDARSGPREGRLD
jgi:MFS family permease